MNDRTPVGINSDSDAFPYIEIGADVAVVHAEGGTDAPGMPADWHVAPHDRRRFQSTADAHRAN
ncbi:MULTISPECIES: hypothetical protein [Burkholderia]|uniref:hypothetical protein n=1 Tax=Burkholderia TaxID=32008 RepID=UPI00078DA577|nr:MULTISPECIES: hypothetical protein [Burkholderia]AMU12736.1 hypothetical protein A3203_06170 [Burkholderia cenocepacia]MCW3584803.1 hypothetical protein [Burkholderia cenocepacia]MCW3630321.1 hypothetical protein [Burkholderia cenocepacia]MCW3645540.1 hypothetical protein [Burkholderia cenocepacia]MCW5178434.1 hypothetical protein [Burkholderia cenocepacia]